LAPPEWGGGLDSEQMEAVSQVAKRRHGEPFALEPVAVELVEAVLCAFFKVSKEARSSWRGVSLAVATTLCDDPVSHGRLEALWGRLAGN
jgi:hypothetical protein